MSRHDTKCDSHRLLRGPGALDVYIPPKPAPHPDDHKRDFPPGDPPEVRYFGVKANYWRALREGEMPFENGTKVFRDEEIAWLRSIQTKVEEILRTM